MVHGRLLLKGARLEEVAGSWIDEFSLWLQNGDEAKATPNKLEFYWVSLTSHSLPHPVSESDPHSSGVLRVVVSCTIILLSIFERRRRNREGREKRQMRKEERRKGGKNKNNANKRGEDGGRSEDGGRVEQLAKDGQSNMLGAGESLASLISSPSAGVSREE